MTPTIFISPITGCWVINGCDTDIPARGPQGEKGEQGEKGDSGEPGKNGSSVLTGRGYPDSSIGADGDSYIDLDYWNYYVKENGTWFYCGNIKGEQGEAGLSEQTEKMVILY